jgi:hypothetical protein
MSASLDKYSYAGSYIFTGKYAAMVRDYQSLPRTSHNVKVSGTGIQTMIFSKIRGAAELQIPPPPATIHSEPVT